MAQEAPVPLVTGAMGGRGAGAGEDKPFQVGTEVVDGEVVEEVVVVQVRDTIQVMDGREATVREGGIWGRRTTPPLTSTNQASKSRGCI